MMTISKSTNGSWLLDYDAPDNAPVGGYRCTFESLHKAIDRAVEFARFAGIHCVIDIKEEK